MTPLDSPDKRYWNYTGCPKIKLALWNHPELASHGFQMGIFNPKKDLLGHEPSRPLLGHLKMYSTNWDPIFNL